MKMCVLLLGIVLSGWCLLLSQGQSSPRLCPTPCRCDGLEGADCSGRGLVTVPSGLSAFTYYLDISMNNITELPANVFGNLPYLEELRLAGNDLTFIHPEALTGLHQLKVLMLQNNHLKTVPSLSLKALPSLQSLRLDANHITVVPEDSFEGLPQLRYLWLDDNNLSEIPVGPLSNLGNLQALTLALNCISYIPDNAFANLSSLVVLHLHNNKIKEIGKNSFNGLDNLETLDLNFNSLESFPVAIQTLPKLKELGFHSNNIAVIPDGAFLKNPLLRTIHLYDNPLSFVGHSAFQNLTDLPALALRGASLLKDFLSLTGTSNLESLTLSGTKISDIPSTLCEDLGLLRALDLSYNKIEELPSFQRCFKIEEISQPIRNTEYLVQVRWELRGSKNMDCLGFPMDCLGFPMDWVGKQCPKPYPRYLQHNGIQQIHRDTFQGMTSLRTLDLSRNEIKYIHKDSFLSFWALTNLDLSLNLLSSFPTAGLSAVSQLKLAGNLEMKGVLTARDLPKLRTISVPYAYQCCAFMGCKTEMTVIQTNGSRIIGEEEEAESLEFSLHCSPSPGAYKPCEQLLGSWMVRLTVWFICLVTLTSNIVVLVATFSTGGLSSPAKLLVGLLAASNLLMGIYVGLLATLDVATWGTFAEFGVRWETGPGCRTAVFLATFSSEWSVLLLVLFAVERSISARRWAKQGKGRQLRLHAACQVAALLALMASGMAFLPLFHIREFSSSPLCLPFSTEETPSLAFTVALVLLNSLAYLLMATVYIHLYYGLGRADMMEPHQASMLRHVAWLIFSNCVFFCPVAAFSFASLLAGVGSKPEVMKSVTLIFFPLPACLNPILYIFFNPHFKEDWCRLRWCGRGRPWTAVTGKENSGACSSSGEKTCDCRMFSHFQGHRALCECCESVMFTKPLACRHLIRSLSCPVLAAVTFEQPETLWSDCRTGSAQSEFADEEDSFVSDSSDQVQACGRACFYQSRGFPLVHYSYSHSSHQRLGK